MKGRDPIHYALYLLGRRGRTRFELQTKLTDKGYEAADVNTTLERLEKLGLINDEEFAQNYARDKVAIYRRGRYRIGMELLKKGVTKEKIAAALEGLQEEDEQAAAESLIQGRLRQWQKLDDRQRYVRAFSLLQRRGFSGKIVKAVLEKLEIKPR